MSEWKSKICEFIDTNHDLLVSVADEIHSNPELAFKEFEASRILSEKLEAAGFQVQLGVAGLDTAIEAIHPERSDGPTIAILAEYDALPEIGHACGHNLIAAAALGASLALGSIKEHIPGRLIFMGTPAEEDIGGKIAMVEAGLFKDVDAAMMFHPSAGYTMVGRKGLALTEVKMEFHGRAAHAAASPEKGINALDAVIQTFNGINALREHIRSSARIHGIISRGGTKPNIVPDYASAAFYVRASTDEYCEELLEKVENCAKGAALATGATLKFERISPSYKARLMNSVLGTLFTENLSIIGEPLVAPPEEGGVGSSDIGNVSQVVPAIHPYISICRSDIAGHSKEFAEAAKSPRGHEAMIAAAKALAMTAIDLMTSPENMDRARKEFKERS
jgi:amidohydrolase